MMIKDIGEKNGNKKVFIVLHLNNRLARFEINFPLQLQQSIIIIIPTKTAQNSLSLITWPLYNYMT